MLTLLKSVKGKTVITINQVSLSSKPNENLVPGFYTKNNNPQFKTSLEGIRGVMGVPLLHCALFRGTFCYARCLFVLVT